MVVKNVRSKAEIKRLDMFLIKFSKSVFIETHSFVLDLLDAHRRTVRRTEIFQYEAHSDVHTRALAV